MKRRTTPTLRVKFSGVQFSDIVRITFLFKQEASESEEKKVEKKYPETVTYDAVAGEFLVPFSEDDTVKFVQDEYFWMDTRIELSGGAIPSTTLVRLKMNKTLFD